MSNATLTYTSYYASGTWYDNVSSFQGPYIKGIGSNSYLYGVLHTVNLNVTAGYKVTSLTFTLPKVMATGSSGTITLYAFLYDHNPKSEFSGYNPSVYVTGQGYVENVSVNSSDSQKTVSISGLNITSSGTYYVFITSTGLSNNTNPLLHSPNSVTCSVYDSLIPKPATNITVSSTLYMGTATTISWSPTVSGYTYKVTYKFTGQSSETNIVSSTSSSSCSWTPPTSLGNNIPNNTSGTATIYVYTYSGGSQVGSKCSQNVTINIPSSGRAPECPTGWASASASKVANAYIAGYSVISATVTTSNITPKYGANLASITASCNSTSQNFTGTSTKSLGYAVSGTNTITFKVTDSRGYSTTYTTSITASSYSPPSFSSLIVLRSDSAGTATSGGHYYTVTPSVSWTSVGTNALVIQTRYKTLSGSYSSYSNCSNNSKTVHGNANINVSDSYIIEVSAYDSVTSSRTIQTRTIVNTGVAATFNLKSNGLGAAFFGLSTVDHMLEVNGSIRNVGSWMYIKDPGLDSSSTPSPDYWSYGLKFQDSSNLDTGVIQNEQKSDGSTCLVIYARKRVNNSYVPNVLTLSIDPSGNRSIETSDSAIWRSGLQVWKYEMDTYPTILTPGGSNSWVKIGTANDSYGILPSQVGAPGSGHNYIGATTWYWKASYIDSMYGTYKGNAIAVANGGTGATTASGARNNLGVEPVLLWTNPSLASNFSAQTVSLSLSSYAFVLIEYGISNYSETSTVLAPTSYVRPTSEYAIPVKRLVGTHYSTTCWRDYYVEGTGVHFYGGYYGSGGSAYADNSMCVPTRIWGILH